MLNHEVDLNRQFLKKSKRRRKKQSVEEKEGQNSLLSLQIGSKDTRTTAVTKEDWSYFVNSNEISNVSDLEIIDFPNLDPIKKIEKFTSDEEQDRINMKIACEKVKQIEVENIGLQKRKEKALLKHDEENIIDFSLKPSELRALLIKQQHWIDEAEKNKYKGIHSPQFEIYCDNFITKELNNATIKLIKEMVHFEEKLHKHVPFKDCPKRRYIVGFPEITKLLKTEKLKLIIIAPDINIHKEDRILNKTIKNLKTLATLSGIPYMFALSRTVISRLCFKTVQVSCFGILDYNGAEELFRTVIELILVAKVQYIAKSPLIKNEDKTIVEIKLNKFLHP